MAAISDIPLITKKDTRHQEHASNRAYCTSGDPTTRRHHAGWSSVELPAGAATAAGGGGTRQQQHHHRQEEEEEMTRHNEAKKPPQIPPASACYWRAKRRAIGNAPFSRPPADGGGRRGEGGSRATAAAQGRRGAARRRGRGRGSAWGLRGVAFVSRAREGKKKKGCTFSESQGTFGRTGGWGGASGDVDGTFDGVGCWRSSPPGVCPATAE